MHIENYIRYIATREGAEPAKNSTNTKPAFETQKKLIDKLVKTYHDSKDLFEYEDYLSHPTRENAAPERPQAFRGCRSKIIFPLKMPGAARRAF